MIVKCTVPHARIVYNTTDHITHSVFGLAKGTIHFYLQPSAGGRVTHRTARFEQNVDVILYIPQPGCFLYPPSRREDK